MRINALSESIQAEFRKIESAKKTDKQQNSAKTTPAAHPTISEGGRRLSSTNSSIDVIAAQISAYDDIRTDKIAEVQEKIKNGYYDSPEFIDKLADKLLSEFGIKPTL